MQVLCPLLKRFQAAPQLVDAIHGDVSAPVPSAEPSTSSNATNTGINGSLHRRRLSTSHHHVRRGTTGVHGDTPAADTELDTTADAGAVDNSDVTVDYDEELPAILRAQHDIYNFGRPVMGGGSWVSQYTTVYYILCATHSR
jgi:hypothetical protein